MTPALTEIRALLKRVEGTTGPDSELDRDITAAFGLQPSGYERNVYRCNFYRNYEDAKSGACWDEWDQDEYTSSLDAAVAFFEAVLPGWFHTSGTCALSGHCSVGPDYNGPERERLLREYLPEKYGGWVFDADLETGTHRQQRAIIAATLRAKIAEMEGENAGL